MGSNHFDGRRFFNPDGRQAKGLVEVLRWKLTDRPTPWPAFIDDVTPVEPPQAVQGAEVRVTMVNHATLLIQMAGCNLLTDPVWSERVSPFSWVGPKRRRRPGIDWEKLPPIHLVLLSHNHYDHLDLPVVRRLAVEHKPHFVTPLGVDKLLRSHGIEADAMDWWDAGRPSGVAVTAVPAQHFSARSPWDRNRTLWTGYVFETPAGSVYFAGDTGYETHFAEIRTRCGPPRLALLPIGAYQPRWFMAPVHMAPEEAVQAHRDLGAQTSIGIHFGTFALTDEGPADPVRELEAALGGDRSFIALPNGGHVTIHGHG